MSMALKEATLGNGKRVKFGRIEPRVRARALSLAAYTADLPSPPPSVPFPVGYMIPMYLNNQLGDCVIAWLLHLIGLTTLLGRKSEVLFADSDAIRLYSAIGGYVPGNPSTDNGCVISDALNYAVNPGVSDAAGGSHQLAGWVYVNGQEMTAVQEAIWLFGHLTIGFGVPDSWINAFQGDGNDVWDVGPGVAPNPENGHCIGFVGYDTQGVWAITWGAPVKITWDAVRLILDPDEGGECESAIANDWDGSGTAPNGLPASQLLIDLQQLADR
jgi:hypothetical protein